MVGILRKIDSMNGNRMINDFSDQTIQNLKKASDKYQEILLFLMQGKGSLIPASLIDSDKTRVMTAKITEQMLEHPEKFINLAIGYGDKFNKLVAESISKFMGKPSEKIIKTDAKDKRFKDRAWDDWIFFDFIKQFYLMSSEYINDHVAEFELEEEHKEYLEFLTRQFINATSPSNFIFSNPLVLKESLESGWQNVVKGLDNFLEDLKKSGDILNIQTTDKAAFKIGKNIAATSGKVVFENELMQLICYEPLQKAYSIPIFIVPPWINKYYVLDLSEGNSLVKWLTQNNFQVFIASWVNPDESFAHKNFEDYVKEGVVEPCQFIAKKFGYEKINAAGYCIGGTLLATSLAYMKAAGLDLINSASFFATLLDFENPGEVGIFINESSVRTIEDNMKDRGYFDGRYLAGSFSLLRANDLVWSFFVNNYLLGKTPLPYDLLYWNNDPSNLPAKMHSFYLRNMYLNNLLKSPGALSMLDRPIDLTQINNPCFFFATKSDHIAPWKSVYAGAKLLGTAPTFCLGESGHVAGVVNPPAFKKYSFYKNDNLAPSAEEWLLGASELDGSWWTFWQEWLTEHSGKINNAIDYAAAESIEPAPGRYVMRTVAC